MESSYIWLLYQGMKTKHKTIKNYFTATETKNGEEYCVLLWSYIFPVKLGLQGLTFTACALYYDSAYIEAQQALHYKYHYPQVKDQLPAP